jgi:hypothetical protein
LLSETTFSYNGDNLIQVSKKNLINSVVEKVIFTTNANATVLAETFLGDFMSQTQLLSTETMSFSNDKLTEKTFVSVTNGTIANRTTTYNYDSAFHPLTNVTGISNIKAYMNCNSSLFSSTGIEGITNNRITESSQFLNGDNTQINFQTEYNTDNFPISKVSTLNSSGNYEYQYSY